MVFKSRFADVTPDAKYKDLVSNFFWDQLDKYRARVLFIDYETGRQWTGAEIKSASVRIAKQLRKNGLKTNDNCVMLYKHCDYILVAALGVLFAGASVCVDFDLDPEDEHAYRLDIMKPSFVFVGHKLVDEMIRLRSSGGHSYKIITMDDGSFEEQQAFRTFAAEKDQRIILGLHHDLLEGTDGDTDASGLPAQVNPMSPAFTLLTSGSTGRPKPVGRSQRNSLYVCHSLMGAKELWDLNESTVMAAHLPLDHGTGIFQLKQCLTHGYKSIIINGYTLESMLDAIQTYRITDLILGSALIHNMLSSRQVMALLTADDAGTKSAALEQKLGSLRNLIAVGSSIASQSLVRQFMNCLPDFSVRQGYGMTECGFMFMVPRELPLRNHDLNTSIVGCAMPNVEFKLVAREESNPGIDSGDSTAPVKDMEITEYDKAGELYVRGPTVSSGYLGDQFLSQSRDKFLPDGFYKTNDRCWFGSDGMLRVLGRLSEVLCLGDGLKVLPSEIELVIMQHPFVREAAVVGIPHPSLPTCHAPRAYIVLQEGVEIDEEDDESDEGKTNDHQLAAGQNENVESAAKNVGYANNLQGDVSNGHNDARKTISKRRLYNFVAERVTEQKRLDGGIKFLDQLPKISIGKVDKLSLKRADGY